ncbi:MAG: hypothetical protein M3070_17205 [Actinomycetota bacterium]|nr:hypothetical protein [Actinomycetota bacterium]
MQAPKPAPTRTVVVQQLPAPVHAAPQYPVYYTPSYYGPTYGDYTLTRVAIPQSRLVPLMRWLRPSRILIGVA